MTQRTLSEDLQTDAKALVDHGYKLRLFVEEGFDDVQIYGYRIPRGFTRSKSDLLLRLPPSYRAGRPDMFWTQTDLLLANGTVPAQAETIETIEGVQWRRFSWHPSSWNPAKDNLFTFLEFIDNRLAMRR